MQTLSKLYAIAGMALACAAAQAATVTVLAAASLTDVFRELGAEFGRRSGHQVRFSFAGSAELAAQIRLGAPADVVAFADRSTFESLQRDGKLGAGTMFAQNELALVLRRGLANPPRTWADLARPGLRLVVGASEVPIGRYTRRGIEAEITDHQTRAKVWANVRSYELNVRAIRAKVRLGEADAGVVYVTDALATESVRLPWRGERPQYWMAATPRSKEPGRAFVRFVVSGEGQAILRRYRFLPPVSAPKKVARL